MLKGALLYIIAPCLIGGHGSTPVEDSHVLNIDQKVGSLEKEYNIGRGK